MSLRALSVPFAGKALASLIAGALFSAAAGELTGPSGPLAVLVDSCGIAAGWIAVEALLRRARAGARRQEQVHGNKEEDHGTDVCPPRA